MKLKALAAKPKLVKVTIDDEDIVERYGESLEFYIYDRQNIDVYMQLTQLENGSIEAIANAVMPLVLDENGDPAIDPSEQLPLDVLVKVIEQVSVTLGNLVSQTTAA
jgi:hypothetical protein